MEVKGHKQKINKFPKTSLAYYIKLYCKQKGSSKTKYQSNLIEATKSWLSLSDNEKQQISAKHKELEQKLKLKYFGQLKNAEPFMKVKDARLENLSLDTNNLVNLEHEVHNKENRLQADIEQLNQIEVDRDITLSSPQLLSDIGSRQGLEENNEVIMEPGTTNEHNSRPVLEEPLPPTLKTGKDLFNILHSTDEKCNVSWISLPQSERNQYNRAVSLLKKDYIVKFKEYLKCLTHRELFDYYNKTII